MKRWSIEWIGSLGKDFGWDEVEASSVESAYKRFKEDHPLKLIKAVSLIPEDLELPSSGMSDGETT